MASLPDADTELLFVRGLAYAGAEETGGFIPEVIVSSLIRRRRYGAAVEALTARSLWVPCTGDRGQPGYRIRRWGDWQEELDALARRRASDRERKRKQRQGERESAQVEDLSRDMSADSPVTVTPPKEVEEERDNPKNSVFFGSAQARDPHPRRLRSHRRHGRMGTRARARPHSRRPRPARDREIPQLLAGQGRQGRDQARLGCHLAQLAPQGRRRHRTAARVTAPANPPAGNRRPIRRRNAARKGTRGKRE